MKTESKDEDVVLPILFIFQVLINIIRIYELPVLLWEAFGVIHKGADFSSI